MRSLTIVREFLTDRMADDYFADLVRPPLPGSVHEFIELMAAGNVALRHHDQGSAAKFPDFTNLHITFSDFLDARVTFSDGTETTVGFFFANNFCTSLARPLITRIAHENSFGPADQTAFREVDANSWGEWADAVSNGDFAKTTATTIYDIFATALKDRTLLSFFIKPALAGEFKMWGPSASSGAGRKLPKRVIPGEGYAVEVTISRYEEVDGPVVAYEWLATLTMDGASSPDAAACGMVYVFERSGGKPLGDLNDLVLVADSMNDDDVMQAKAFIDQHSDAEGLIETSDLCFVWIWEKRSGVEKGIGAKCLVSALMDIRRRFKKVRTAIFDVRPSQFVNWTPKIEPPMVAVEKQTAIENLVHYIQSLPVDFELVPIFNRSRDPFNDALMTIHQASLSKFDEDEDADADAGIDIDRWRSEIAELLAEAGLHDLSNDIDLEEESEGEVEAALRHLVFDANVHYVRVPNSFDTSRAVMTPRELIPIDQALNDFPEFEEFFQSLPDEMHVQAVYLAEGLFVCEVIATTPFGEIVDYFTLVRKPRPTNIYSFFRKFEN